MILFFSHGLQSIIFSSKETACGLLSEFFDFMLPVGEQILGPADFGAHNPVTAVNGPNIFIDFVYFSWDDKVKFVSMVIGTRQ